VSASHPVDTESGHTPGHRLSNTANRDLLESSVRRGLEPRDPPMRLPDVDASQNLTQGSSDMSEKEYNALNRSRNVRAWLVPFVKSKVRSKEFRPILSYLFTDWKCNLECHYCWAFNNDIPGMTEDTARRSVDWLHSVGCRVIAIMGGEPLIRPRFIQKLVAYGARRGFFVYLPTNGRLMRPEVIDYIGGAGVAVWNLAVDAVDLKPGLPKALNPIRPYFEYLVKNQRRYGYLAFFNINITRTNMEDVKQLTEIARDNGIATDYHINESPMLEQEHFRFLDDNSTFLRPEDYPKVDDLLDYLIDKNRSGYKMVNSCQHLEDMKGFMRGRIERWDCRAGHNTALIRTDGSIAPCFSMYSATHDWGTVEDPKLDFVQLKEMQTTCMPHCLSTCQHTVGYAYDTWRVLKWLGKQALRGFRGVSGGF
jgi:MoaA/NifB/PqqE/SkfB family radical SAM enzyme